MGKKIKNGKELKINFYQDFYYGQMYDKTNYSAFNTLSINMMLLAT